MNIETQLDLMILIIKKFSEKFPAQAILRGGMVLYILNSRRYTNDLDYAFIPYKSKNDIIKPVVECLKEVENIKFNYNLNSKCLRFNIFHKEIKIQLEIKVYDDLKSVGISTSVLDNIKIPNFIVSVADHNWSLANKVMAWWERRLVRDLYDIYFLHNKLGAKLDFATLKRRIKKIEYAKNVKKQMRSLELHQFSEVFGKEVAKFDSKEIEDSLLDYFTQNEIQGVGSKIRIALNEILEEIKEEVERYIDS